MPKKTTPDTAAQKRVLIVDDHPIFRAGLTGLVNLEAELTVCGEAHDAAQAMQAVEKLQPDLVLLDMSIPGKGGLELLKDIRAIAPRTPLLVISMHDETLYAERVIRAGGRGYIMKQEGPGKIIHAIRKVLSGGIAVSERMAALILDALSGTKSGAASVSTLTDREFEVYRLLGQGKEPHEIARMLHLSIKTVDTHRMHIRQKLSIRNATELIHHATRWAAEQG
ncbi:response regulator transcription factor [Prosthecobacter sp.]|uniref:response regulator transcription factor n=1 Tax=Prosthecobacter sp. TaxID=1965333 RepID=UPI00248926E5|nr:response regulator transcription factor [Prosthecobacter sp.]MDI1311820.1 response regulator transcription factor [Prosthecobacter sp.]